MPDVNLPKVSVIITNYNYAEYVGRAIESVLSQTYRNIELIIVDDGSGDDSDKVISGYVKANPQITYIKQKNQGVVSARNKGMTTATGAFLCCLDADDWFNPDYIEKNYEYITKYDADVVFPNWSFSGDMSGKTDFPEFDFTEYQKQHLHIKPESLVRSSAIKNKDGTLKYGYLPETKARANDWAYFISLAANGLKFKLAKDNYVNYQIKEGSMGKSFSRSDDLRIFFNYLTMFHKRYGSKIIDPIELPIDIIEHQDAAIVEKDQIIQGQLELLKEKDRAIRARDENIASIYKSFSWRASAPLRAPRHFLRAASEKLRSHPKE
jgi:glycosyltransferase involved in cell wall biosynthesis